MNLSGHTILITGGTSGIGLELATRLMPLGNTVIVTGRDREKIEDARKQLPGVHAFQSDVADSTAIATLFDTVTRQFPGLNVLINNAGIMHTVDFRQTTASLDDIGREIETDLTGPIRMVRQFLPHLLAQQTAAIVNVSSGLAFVPLPLAPVYCAAKAGIHSFTRSLRAQLRGTHVRVFELAPPITQTAILPADLHIEKLPVRPMNLGKMVDHAIDGLRHDRWEIRPGPSTILKLVSRIAPGFTLPLARSR